MLAAIASGLSSPLIHAPLLFVLLLLLARITRFSRLFRLLSVLPIVWLILCSMTYPSTLLIKNLENQYPAVKLPSQQWQHSDAIVVMAYYYFEDNQLPEISRWPDSSLQRNLQAALMYKTHQMPIYLAGGILGPDNKVAIAEHNKQFLIMMGVKEADIHTVPQGYNTESELAALAPQLKGKKIALITSASHLPRTTNYFEYFGLDYLAIPVDHLSKITIKPMIDLPNARALYRSERAIHEYLGLLYQKIFL